MLRISLNKKTNHRRTLYLFVLLILFGCEAGGELDNTEYSQKTVPQDHDQSTADSCANDQCHNQGSVNSHKAQTHPQTSELCGFCHTTGSWLPLINPFDHFYTSDSCTTCHNGIIATGKPPTHIATTLDCGTCHTPSNFGVVFDHSTLQGQPCAQSGCHDGVSGPTFKSAAHPLTTNTCEACHTTNAWLPVSVPFSHSDSADLCASCHNGTIATNKSGSHPLTSDTCVVCHNTSNWLNINTPMDHSQTSEPSCRNVACHQDTDKPPNHTPTNQSCENCHGSTEDWTILL